jgi:hypothetical protein
MTHQTQYCARRVQPFSSKSITRGLLAAMAIGSLAAHQLEAQSCTGTASCSVTNTASVTISAIVSMTLGSTTTTLTAPTESDLTTGYVQASGPSITIKANRTWSLSISTSNTTNWTYSGSDNGVKPIGDLTWATTSGGTYTAITGSAATLYSSQAASNGASKSIFFRVLYPNDLADARVAPGTYSIPIVFTVSAP